MAIGLEVTAVTMIASFKVFIIYYSILCNCIFILVRETDGSILSFGRRGIMLNSSS